MIKNNQKNQVAVVTYSDDFFSSKRRTRKIILSVGGEI